MALLCIARKEAVLGDLPTCSRPGIETGHLFKTVEMIPFERARGHDGLDLPLILLDSAFA